jgi:hypothetical protein
MGENQAARMREDIRSMREKFGAEELIAGSEILKALSSELDFVHKKELSFYREGDLAWVLEYVAAKTRYRK